MNELEGIGIAYMTAIMVFKNRYRYGLRAIHRITIQVRLTLDPINDLKNGIFNRIPIQ